MERDNVQILITSSEAVPFSKTGGLADVCGALPRAIEHLGHQAVLMVPAYRSTMNSSLMIEPLGIEFVIPIGTKTVTGQLLRAQIPDSDVQVYLIRQDKYFDRKGLYGENGKDYPDNCERFVFFSRAVMEAIRLLHLNVDVIHANDWQTGLIPAYLQTQYRHVPQYSKIASIFTVHNLAYQGIFWHWDMLLTGLDWKYFNLHQMEYYGKLSLLKTGIAFADSITTVSPRYALEIQTDQFGCGFDPLLRHRGNDLYGILNGVDTKVWNPATDELIAEKYDINTYAEGKAKCKAALQKRLGLPQQPDIPMIGLIGRVAHQKGFDMVATVMEQWCREGRDIQWVILGEGDDRIEDRLKDIAARFPSNVAVEIDFDESLAHSIEAGSDMFLMASRFEPCGLSQMYSMLYGTLPVVSETGGLADTVVEMTPGTLKNKTAVGFRFEMGSVFAMANTLEMAIDVFTNNREAWNSMIENGMKSDLSWERSAQKYVELYEQTIATLDRRMNLF